MVFPTHAPYEQLANRLGAAKVSTDPDVVARYSRDWTGRFVGSAAAVVRPDTAAEIGETLRWCASKGVAVVPQGGNTGLVGGGVPLAGELVLSCERLRRLDPVDTTAGQVTAGAGVPLGDLQRHAAATGWAYPVDLSARDTATVGGNVATNAGGIHVIRYGATRAQLVGVEAVLADGSIVGDLRGLVKDNTGYHLPSLLCGSEGTLGVVTAARVRLVPGLENRVAALIAFEDVGAALEALTAMRLGLPTLEAAELFFHDGLALVCDTFALSPPFAAPHATYVLVECADNGDAVGPLAAVVGDIQHADVAVATESVPRGQLWRYREAHTEAINVLGTPHKLDVTLPAAAMQQFLDRVRTTVREAAPQARTWLFGHAADGNIHVNITGVAATDEIVDEAVLALVADLGGSISAEHGIGTAKKRWLHLTRSAADIAAMRAIKRSLDPDGILNPNALLP